MNLTGKEIQKRLSDLQEMTDLNNHNEALVSGCQLLIDLGCHIEDIQNKIKTIGYSIERLGYLPYNLSQERYKMYELMIKSSKSVFGEKLADEFRMCF